MKKPLLITIAICTRNRAAFLRAAVESVLPQLTEDVDLLLVDNASTDDTAEIARAFAADDARVSVLREAELGLSVARNTALRHACGQFVVFLDDDATVEHGWVAAYRGLVLRPPTPDLAAMGGPVFPNYDGPTPAWLSPSAHTLNRSDQSQEFPANGFPWGCNFGVHRELAIAIGGFDPRLGHNGKRLSAHEETELLKKLNRSGGRVWWVSQARIRHHVAADRLRLGCQVRSWFNTGRASALMRMSGMTSSRDRWMFWLSRLLGTPFHCAANLLVALVTSPFQQQQVAVAAFLRSARIVGYAWELVVAAPRILFSR